MKYNYANLYHFKIYVKCSYTSIDVEMYPPWAVQSDTDMQGNLAAAQAAESVPPAAAAVSSSVRESAGHPTMAARHTPLLLSGTSLWFPSFQADLGNREIKFKWPLATFFSHNVISEQSYDVN